MPKLFLLLPALLVIACNAPRDNENEQSTQENAAVDTETAEVIFRCDTINNSDKHQLSILLSTHEQAIIIDTLDACEPIPESHYATYSVPQNIEGIALGDDNIYYGTIEGDQLVVMRSTKGDTMDYQVHLSIPLKPVVKEEEEL